MLSKNHNCMAEKERIKQLLNLWELALKSYLDYKDQFYTKLMNGDVVKRATKVLGKVELDTIKQLERRERTLRLAWEKALV